MVYIFAKLAEVRGVVRTILNKDLHLVAELEDGRLVVGQHLMTGKEVAPISSPIKRVYLTENLEDPAPANPSIRHKAAEL